MEPDIRYCTTTDGLSIAYYAMGGGPTLVVASTVLSSNVRYPMMFMPEYQRTGEGIGRGMRLVRYDSRGTGMSDRSALDFSLEARIRDLDAVVAKLGLADFALAASTYGCLAAVEYAARNPGKVSKLVLSNPVVDGGEMRDRVRRWDSLRDMANEEWEDYTTTVAAANVGYDQPELIQIMAQRMRESMSPASVQATFQALASIDVRPSLPKLTIPTLIMYRGLFTRVIKRDDAQSVANAIPNAEFVETRLASGELWSQADTDAIERFLGIAPAPAAVATLAGPKDTPQRDPTAVLQTILFTDIADSTALTERLGDTVFRTASRSLDTSIRAAIRDSGGTPVAGKVLGDGVMGVFTSATHAIQAARACVERSGDLPLHIGIHAGDVIREDDNVYGGAVNIASRICGLCDPGEILVSATIRELARTSAGVTFEDRGEHALKGIADAVRVFAVRTAE